MARPSRRSPALAAALTLVLLWSTAATHVDARTADGIRLERILVDLRQKDCLGRPFSAPEIVEPQDFKVIARDAKTLQDSLVPVSLLAYDEERGIAEIAFPFRNGFIYSIKTAF